MVATVLIPVRFRTLDIAVCSGDALVIEFPVKFQRRYVLRQQVRKKNEAGKMLEITSQSNNTNEIRHHILIR